MTTPTSSTTPAIPIADLERAINRARASQPATGSEASLSRDVALLGGLYGRLIFRGQASFGEDDLTEAERDALRRWRG